jgi:hypothetical protein
MKISVEYGGNDDRDNRSIQMKICASATLSIINLTWTGVISSLGHCSEIPGSNDLEHGTPPIKI